MVGVVGRFERRLEGMVGDAFARVFGGRVVPQEVAHALQREAEAGTRPLAGGRTLAPNRYTVTLGAADHDRLTGDEQRVIQLLRDCITEHLAEYGWDTYGDVIVHLERSDTLHTGQFRTSASVDPNASRRSTAQPRTAGDPAMSQQPPQHPEGDQRGQHGGHGHDQGQEQDLAYGQQYGQGPGYNQNPDPGYGGQPGSYGYDQSQGYNQQYGYDQQYGSHYGQGQNQGQGQGYDQGYVQQGGYDQGQGGYDQGQGGYDQGQGGYGYDQNYDQNYGQYGGAPGGYGYDQNQGYGGGYAPDPGAQGYAPPAVQTGARQLTAALSLDDGSNRTHELTLGSNVVGRGQDAQFRLPDTGVSRRHLEITWDGQVAVLADLGSTNGTTVNGSPIQTWQLADGDVVRVGNSSLVFHVQS